MFVSLVNDQELYGVFASEAPGAVPGTLSRLEQAVGRRMLGATGFELEPFSSGRIAEKQRYRAALLLDRLMRRPLRRLPPRQDAPVCFLIDHAKFLPFVSPVVAEIGAERCVFLSSVGRLEASAVRQLTVDYPPGEQREARAIGAALRDHAHLARSYDVLVRKLEEVAPLCTVVIEGNSPHDELTNRACRALGIPCVCMQQGWAPLVHTGFRNMSYTAMAVWGDGFRELLAPHNPDERFVVTGSPAFASGRSSRRAPWNGHRCAAFFFQGVSQLIGRENLDEMMDLVRTAAERFKDDLLLVREHPGAPFSDRDRTSLQESPNVRLVPLGSHSLKEVLDASRVAVAIYSTSLLEAAAAGTPALAFNTTSLPRYSPDLEEHGVGVETRSVDVALDALDRLLHDDAEHASFGPALERFRERFFAGADGEAPERIATLIGELATD